MSSSTLFAQDQGPDKCNHKGDETVHKRGEQTERVERFKQNRREMQNIQGNRRDDSSLPRLEKFIELETELMTERLKFTKELVEVLASNQSELVENYRKARLEIEKEAQDKRE